MSEDSIVAIVTAIIMSGALSSLAGWATQHLAKRRGTVTKADLEVFARQLEKGDRHFDVLDRQEQQLVGQIHDLKLIVLRQCLFAHPFDQNSHESAIQSGREYSRIGGNGVGHIRLTQLEENYARRVHDDDWDYTHDRP
jgi:hypothetical protein